MEFSTRVAAPESIKADCVAVGIHAGGDMTAAARRIDAASKGALRAALKSGDFPAKRGTSLLLRQLPGVTATRVLLVGLGKREDFSDRAYQDAARAAVRAAGPGSKDIAVAAADWVVRDRDLRWQALQLVIAARETAFRSDELKSQKDDAKEGGNGHGKHHRKDQGKEDGEPGGRGVNAVHLLLDRRETSADKGLVEGAAIAGGMELAKRLGNLPANVCTPTFLASQARELGRAHKLAVQVLDRKQIEALKMGSFLSVAKGSDEPPRFIVLRHDGGSSGGAPVVLVGKGITFDSGGISLKPGAAMDEMKYDMCGAAAVLGTLRAVAELKLKINVVGIIPSCENLPSGRANKPGDIVTSMSGQTIEILNTDAEGRLILCDALTYAERFKPAVVVDIATLTGACVVALGHVNSGLFTSDDELAEQLAAAGRQMVDPAWRLPLEPEYQEQLKSNFADMANIGTPANAGATAAACFLARYTKAYRWAHLDIAGTAWKGGAAKGATGRPVPLLVQFLIRRT